MVKQLKRDNAKRRQTERGQTKRRQKKRGQTKRRQTKRGQTKRGKVERRQTKRKKQSREIRASNRWKRCFSCGLTDRPYDPTNEDAMEWIARHPSLCSRGEPENLDSIKSMMKRQRKAEEQGEPRADHPLREASRPLSRAENTSSTHAQLDQRVREIAREQGAHVPYGHGVR